MEAGEPVFGWFVFGLILTLLGGLMWFRSRKKTTTSQPPRGIRRLIAPKKQKETDKSEGAEGEEKS